MPRVTDLIRKKIEIDSGIPKTDFSHLNKWEERQGYSPTGLTLRWIEINQQIRNTPALTNELFRRMRKEGD